MGAADSSYRQARCAREVYEARIKKLEYEVRAGVLVSAVEVEQTWSGILSATRNKLLGIPTMLRVAAPHLSAKDLAIVEELITETLIDLADGTSKPETSNPVEDGRTKEAQQH